MPLGEIMLRSAGTSRFSPSLAGGVIALGALAAYRHSFAGPFIYDDRFAIVENPTIRHFWSAFWPPPGTTASGRPVLNLSLALNYAVSAYRVWSYHALNLSIHVLAGLTLFGIIRRTLSGANRTFLAFSISLLWTLHPLQTESVTYIVQRAESLMGLFYLLTLYCFIRYADPTSSGGLGSPFDFAQDLRRNAQSVPLRNPSIRWDWLCVLFCLAGVATKEVMVTAPVIVLLYDRTFISGSFREAWRRHRGVHAALAATWLVLAGLVASTGGNRGGSIGFGIGVPWWAYALTQFRAVITYLRLAAWPHPLIFDRGPMWVSRPMDVAPYALAVAALIAASVFALRQPAERSPGLRALGFAGAWFFIILAPTSSIVPGTTQMIVEHRMYLPLAAILALGVVGAAALIGRRGLVALLLLALPLAWLTARRNEAYRSNLSIWSDTVSRAAANPLAQSNLAEALENAGQFNEAITHAKEALRLRPDLVDAQVNLGLALAAVGRRDEAVAYYEAALRTHPELASIHNDLGLILVDEGRLPAAIVQFEAALRLDPGAVSTRNNYGAALLKLGRAAESIPQFERALRSDPSRLETRRNLAKAEYNLGNTESSAGRRPEAIVHYRRSLELDPDAPETLNNLGIAEAQSGLLAEAVAHFEAAVRLKSDYVDARRNLNNARRAGAETGYPPERPEPVTSP